MSAQRFPRGARATLRHAATMADGSHRDGWSHRIIAAGSPVTVTGSSRWYVMVRDDLGGEATLPRSALILAADLA